MTPQTNQQEIWKAAVGRKAAQFVEEGMVIGLGTGSTATYFIQALGEKIQQGLHIIGAVPSSNATGDLALSLNIPVTDLDTHSELDIYIDGADEIDPQLRLIKGAGGALLREKIVATAARRFIVIADQTKLVPQLGTHSPVPVEVIPLARGPVWRQLAALGAKIHQREKAGQTFITDNQNIILDCTFPQGISQPEELDARIQSIVGVVETGLFLRTASQAIVGGPDGIEILHRSKE